MGGFVSRVDCCKTELSPVSYMERELKKEELAKRKKDVVDSALYSALYDIKNFMVILGRKHEEE